jgi:hypothetical protein
MFGTGAGLLWRCSIPITDIKGLYLYPCPNTTPGRLRAQHLISKLMFRRQCPSCTRHQLVLSLHPGHVITHSRKLLFTSANNSFAQWWCIANRKHLYRILWGLFPCRMVFCYQTRPTSQSLSCTNFWCSHMPLQLRDKSDFIPELTINAQRLWAKFVQHSFFPLAICWSPRSDPNPRSSISQAQIFNGRPKSSYSGKSHPLKVHSVLLFRSPP